MICHICCHPKGLLVTPYSCSHAHSVTETALPRTNLPSERPHATGSWKGLLACCRCCHAFTKCHFGYNCCSQQTKLPCWTRRLPPTTSIASSSQTSLHITEPVHWVKPAVGLSQPPCTAIKQIQSSQHEVQPTHPSEIINPTCSLRDMH